MRVVAGDAAGLRLKGPSGQGVRPTTDKVREAVFNALHSLDAVEGAAVVDLFAGTGACGIEALSRGAATATFVERDRKALEVLRENLRTTDLIGRATVQPSDVMTYLRATHAFDLAFADPPYAFDDWATLLDLIRVPLVVCETGSVLTPPTGWDSIRQKRYGDTTVTFLRCVA